MEHYIYVAAYVAAEVRIADVTAYYLESVGLRNVFEPSPVVE